jgi:hypothetical protein
VVRGAGERPAKSSLTSPVYVLPDCASLWKAFAHLAYKYSKKSARSLPLYWRVSACLPCGDRTVVLRLQRRCGCSVCQPFSLDAMDRTPRI